MSYYDLFKILGINKIKKLNFLINGLTSDSRTLIKGNLFVAMLGEKTNGRNYIKDAIEKGASAILLESKNIKNNGKVRMINKIPFIYIKELRKNISKIAGNFYSHPSRLFNLVGITGTNGKTTIAHLLAQWTYLLGEKSAVMGTIGNGLINDISPSKNTTESGIEIQKSLANFYKNKVNFVAIEVSSHGLLQNRVDGLYFSAAVFTNLSHDHLDYHINMNNYEHAKLKLFNELNVYKKIININDYTGIRWAKIIPEATIVNGIIFNKKHDFWLYAKKIYYDGYNTYIYINSSWGIGTLHISILGILNISNVLLSLATLLSLGYSFKDLLKLSNKLKSVCGRMEKFCSKKFPTILLDYAHNPNALMQSLISAKMYCKGKLWCIFGCGGNRDKSKRPIMGYIAERYSDYVLITEDNSRDESFYDIVDDIIQGVKNTKKIYVINNRLKAIYFAIMKSSLMDLILITGKGHENYQIIKKRHIYHSDRETIIKIIGNNLI